MDSVKSKPPFDNENVEAALLDARDNPEQAKVLLREAGYPNGFKILQKDLPASLINLAGMQSYWADIGVDVIVEDE